MSDTRNSNEPGIEGELLEQQFTGEQATALQQLLRFQGEDKPSPLLWTIRLRKALRSIVGAIPCGRPVVLHFLGHSPTKSIFARLQGEDKPSPLLWTSFSRRFIVA